MRGTYVAGNWRKKETQVKRAVGMPVAERATALSARLSASRLSGGVAQPVNPPIHTFGRSMRPACALLVVGVALLACGGTEPPEYPPFENAAPTVSHFSMSGGQATAILRDPQGGATIGRTDYTYVYFYREGSTDSHVSFAQEWTWTRIDDLTWRVTVPGLTQSWSGAAWHVADEDSNIQTYKCTNVTGCTRVEEPV